jgi:hypothetical protein
MKQRAFWQALEGRYERSSLVSSAGVYRGRCGVGQARMMQGRYWSFSLITVAAERDMLPHPLVENARQYVVESKLGLEIGPLSK